MAKTWQYNIRIDKDPATFDLTYSYKFPVMTPTGVETRWATKAKPCPQAKALLQSFDLRRNRDYHIDFDEKTHTLIYQLDDSRAAMMLSLIASHNKTGNDWSVSVKCQCPGCGLTFYP